MSKWYKRGNGTGSVKYLKNRRLRYPYIALAPAIREYDEETGIVKIIQTRIGSYRTRKEAEAALAAYLADPSDRNSDYTVKQVIDLWLEDTQKGQKPISDRRRQILTTTSERLKPIYDRSIKQLTLDEAQGCIDACVDAITMQKIIKQILLGITKYAQVRGWRQNDFSRYLKLAPHEPEEKVPFTKEEIRILWQEAEKKKEDKTIQARDADMALLMLYSGMRIEEACKMRIKDIDFEKRLMKGGSKTEAGKNRIIPIHRDIVEPLERIIESATASDLDMLYKVSGGYLYREHYFYPMMERLYGDSKKHVPHDARVTFVSQWRALRLSDHALKMIIGHKAEETITDHYTKLPSDHLIEQMDLFHFD